MALLESITDPQIIMSGVWRAVHPRAVPLWQDGQNVLFSDLAVKSAEGWTEVYAHDAEITELIQTESVDGDKRIFFGSDGKLLLRENATVSTIGDNLGSGRWMFTPWGDWLAAVNGAASDRLFLWKDDGFGKLKADLQVTDSPQGMTIIRSLQNHLVGFKDKEVYWSDLDGPEVWTAAADNRAGSLPLRNLDSNVVACEEFSDRLAFFTRSSMYLLNYVAGQAVFGYQRVTSVSIGAIGRHAVVTASNGLFGLERRGFWFTDGAQSRFIAEPAQWEYFKDTIDFDRGDEIIALHNVKDSCVEWSWVKTDGNREGASYNYELGTWSPTSFARTAADESGTFSGFVFAEDSKLFLGTNGRNAGSSALYSYIQSKPLALSSEHVFKFIAEVRLRFESTGTPTLSFGVMTEPRGTIEWLGTNGLTERSFPHRETVFLVIRIDCNDLNSSWELSQILVYGERTGSTL